MADIKVKCESIRCEQTSGWGMEVTCNGILETDRKLVSIEEYETLFEDKDVLRSMLDETEIMLRESREENIKLKQKVKNLRRKLNG